MATLRSQVPQTLLVLSRIKAINTTSTSEDTDHVGKFKFHVFYCDVLLFHIVDFGILFFRVINFDMGRIRAAPFEPCVVQYASFDHCFLEGLGDTASVHNIRGFQRCDKFRLK
ncbi:hypothetical protein NEMBOFW57_001594 [Staphylotrichum longicolle]|uniref:Uncharacterized protein n=1 Tax=Staphylotrichum longicolle TaxID=669026 RepID=A0AAD4F2M2_9PEZI|nr:hypothetical protein NEMBOFW57_001594 [Staphylotrichum longicolle]